MEARLRGPLSMQHFDMVLACMMRGVDGYTPSRPPFELELRRDVRTNLYNLDWFLAHPPDITGEARGLDESESLTVWQEVGGQVAELFYLLQRDLIAELTPEAEDPAAAAKTIAATVFLNGQQLVLANLYSPTTRVFKRPLSSEEMDGLRVRVGAAVASSAQVFERAMAEAPQFGQTVALQQAVGPAASSLAAAIQGVYWAEWPPMLSPAEQQALDEALAARYSAEEPAS